MPRLPGSSGPAAPEAEADRAVKLGGPEYQAQAVRAHARMVGRTIGEEIKKAITEKFEKQQEWLLSMKPQILKRGWRVSLPKRKF
jgi:hypothetical protein